MRRRVTQSLLVLAAVGAVGTICLFTVGLRRGHAADEAMYDGGMPELPRIKTSMPATDNGAPSAAGAAGDGTGALLTICNNLPGVVTAITEPGGECVRIPWGAGVYALGDEPVQAITLYYHDAYWPYVYQLWCPGDGKRHTVEMMELWRGEVPVGFQLRRGRPDGTGEIIWFDEPEADRHAGVGGPIL